MQKRFTAKDVTIISDEQASKGFLSIHKLQLKHALFPRGESKAITREVMHRGKASAILIHDPQHNLVMTLEQFRVGGLAEDDGPWFIEIPAGMIDSGETPAEAAIREAWEETGCRISNITPIAAFFPSPGGCSEKVHLFYGTADLSGYGEQIHGEGSDNENLLARAVPFEDALNWIYSGIIKDAASIMALFWLKGQQPPISADLNP
jgi:ADP-ribose pyrophosphatase